MRHVPARSTPFPPCRSHRTRPPHRPQERTTKLRDLVQEVSRDLEDDKKREVDELVKQMKVEKEQAKEQAEQAANNLAAKEVKSLQAQLAEEKEESDRLNTFNTGLSVKMRSLKDSVNYVDDKLLASKEHHGFLSELEDAHNCGLQNPGRRCVAASQSLSARLA